jgi:hypothetical protein
MAKILKQTKGEKVVKEVLFTPSAAARFVGKSEATVRYAVTTGKLPCVRTTTGVRLFRQSDLEDFARKRGEKPSSEHPSPEVA